VSLIYPGHFIKRTEPVKIKRKISNVEQGMLNIEVLYRYSGKQLARPLSGGLTVFPGATLSRSIKSF
jgi:hypothetical protein